MTTGLKLYTKTSLVYSSSPGGYLWTKEWYTYTKSTNRFNLTTTRKKVQSSESKLEKMTICEATTHQDGISKGIFQYCATYDYVAFATQRPTNNYL
jgi:hypothetical protein